MAEFFVNRPVSTGNWNRLDWDGARVAFESAAKHCTLEGAPALTRKAHGRVTEALRAKAAQTPNPGPIDRLRRALPWHQSTEPDVRRAAAAWDSLQSILSSAAGMIEQGKVVAPIMDRITEPSFRQLRRGAKDLKAITGLDFQLGRFTALMQALRTTDHNYVYHQLEGMRSSLEGYH